MWKERARSSEPELSFADQAGERSAGAIAGKSDLVSSNMAVVTLRILGQLGPRPRLSVDQWSGIGLFVSGSTGAEVRWLNRISSNHRRSLVALYYRVEVIWPFSTYTGQAFSRLMNQFRQA